MRASTSLVIEAIHAAWAAQDLGLLEASLHDDAIYHLHLPPGAWPIAGLVQGRATIVRLLQAILTDFEVVEYRVLKIDSGNGMHTARARAHYRHRATGLCYEATVRSRWTLQGALVRRYEVFHDAARLGAFFAMVSNMREEAQVR